MSVTLQTNYGNLKVSLYCEIAPKCSENFLALCAKGYYNNTNIHRNIKGFIVQMGDPTGTGKGGESIWNENFEDEITPLLRHSKRGILSMANSGLNTNGSQFFITYGKQITLDGRNTVFGQVIDGFDTLTKIENLPVDSNYKPIDPIIIKNVIIHANPIAETQWQNKSL